MSVFCFVSVLGNPWNFSSISWFRFYCLFQLIYSLECQMFICLISISGASRVRELPPEQFCKQGFVIGKASQAGFGNEMYKILTSAALSIMLNRSLIIGQTRHIGSPSCLSFFTRKNLNWSYYHFNLDLFVPLPYWWFQLIALKKFFGSETNDLLYLLPKYPFMK